jgi:hypothetical protein
MLIAWFLVGFLYMHPQPTSRSIVIGGFVWILVALGFITGLVSLARIEVMANRLCASLVLAISIIAAFLLMLLAITTVQIQ